MRITKDELTIRYAGPDDASHLCRWWNGGALMAHAGFPKGLGTTEEIILEQIASWTDETHRLLILEVDSFPVGEMNYKGRVGEPVSSKCSSTTFFQKDMKRSSWIRT